MSVPSFAAVEMLNRYCHCVGTDVAGLRAKLDLDLGAEARASSLAKTHPHLYSPSPVFISTEQAEEMRRIVSAVEVVIVLPEYQRIALESAPPIARRAVRSRGVFLGYDFHLTKDGPKLIEINTNAGGALLNAEMMRAQAACCPEALDYLDSQPAPSKLENDFYSMFLSEWTLMRGVDTLSCVAIVDDNPKEQFLYPEFLLFQKLFESRGVRAVIAAPEQLRYEDGTLWFGDRSIDLLYNRLTDFYFERPEHAAIAAAYRDDSVVVTPHPRAHALYANKRNLSLLTDERQLKSFGIAPGIQSLLVKGIPQTLSVRSRSASNWWAERKQWFFKPATGFGSRGSYRGDKLTRSVFEKLMSEDYVAQRFAAPGERWIDSGGGARSLKYDVRNYVYHGGDSASHVQLIAARLYHGQTTNFRTECGGFAPIYLVDGDVCSQRLTT